MLSNGVAVRILQKDESFIKSLFVKRSIRYKKPRQEAETDMEPEGDSDHEESEDDSLFVYSVKSSCVAEDEQF